ncbi:MAG: VanZ family protein [candidate division Zixibacteria bacterium]|nr:VanZ family protein [candidate division Zixibacteria bacterium]
MFTNSRMNSSSSKSGSVRTFLVYHLPVVLFAAAILTVSSLTGLQTPDVKVVALDKLAHLLEYAIFSFLTYRSFCRWELRLVSKHAFGFSALFLSLFAAFDEIFQRFIPGRSSEVWDVLADLLGALLVLVLMEMHRRRATRGRDHCS